MTDHKPRTTPCGSPTCVCVNPPTDPKGLEGVESYVPLPDTSEVLIHGFPPDTKLICNDQQGGNLLALAVVQIGEEELFLILEADLLADDPEWIPKQKYAGAAFGDIGGDTKNLQVFFPREVTVHNYRENARFVLVVNHHTAEAYRVNLHVLQFMGGVSEAEPIMSTSVTTCQFSGDPGEGCLMAMCGRPVSFRADGCTCDAQHSPGSPGVVYRSDVVPGPNAGMALNLADMTCFDHNGNDVTHTVVTACILPPVFKTAACVFEGRAQPYSCKRVPVCTVPCGGTMAESTERGDLVLVSGAGYVQVLPARALVPHCDQAKEFKPWDFDPQSVARFDATPRRPIAGELQPADTRVVKTVFRRGHDAMLFVIYADGCVVRNRMRRMHGHCLPRKECPNTPRG